MKKLSHKFNKLQIEISGNFTDSENSMFHISRSGCWHVTFVKISKGRVDEHLREVIVMEGLDDVYLSEVEFTYRSEFESVRSYRAFLRKQEKYEDNKAILQRLFQTNTIKQERYFDFDNDTPF